MQISMAQVAEKPPSVTALHKRWVRKFESEQAAHRLEEQMAATQEEDKIKAVGDFSAKLRTAILADDDTSFWKATQRPGEEGEGSGVQCSRQWNDRSSFILTNSSSTRACALVTAD